MTCPICDAALEKPHEHHDHLRDVAGDHLAQILPPAHVLSAGHLEDTLQRSGRLDPHLRFSQSVLICDACNTLENAWKIGSNKNRDNPGFLPASFSLLADEIAFVRSKRVERNNETDVREAILAIWLGHREDHVRRRLMIEREVRGFLLDRGLDLDGDG